MSKGTGRRIRLSWVAAAVAAGALISGPNGAMAQSGDSVAGSCPDPGKTYLYQLNELPHGRGFAGPFAGQVFTAQNGGPPTHGQVLLLKRGVGTGGFVMQLYTVSGNSLGDLIATGSLLDFGVPLNTYATATFELDPPEQDITRARQGPAIRDRRDPARSPAR